MMWQTQTVLHPKIHRKALTRNRQSFSSRNKETTAAAAATTATYSPYTLDPAKVMSSCALGAWEVLKFDRDNKLPT